MPDAIMQTGADRLAIYARNALEDARGRVNDALPDFLALVSRDASAMTELFRPELDAAVMDALATAAKELRADKDAQKDGGVGHDLADIQRTRARSSAPIIIPPPRRKTILDLFVMPATGKPIGDCTRADLIKERDAAVMRIAKHEATDRLMTWAIDRCGSTGTLRDWVSADDLAAAMKDANHA